ncbi:prostaglandin F2 receptor negative regulator-like [Conger conger]|uniref:prostaglandin F2 receptor negative regulator-like n=1 Tax=Conger conger TaxID=82655 RepID=UPI002A5A24A5|nr:prostaglandin F2 receptor negative regulator-like [Conger conger]
MASFPKDIQRAGFGSGKMRSALFTFFIFILTSGRAGGRVVTVSQGPLVRVEGQAAALGCSVREYEGPTEQDFDWKVLRDDRWLQVISTFDLRFADQSLQGRVDSGDITVERRGPASVALLIGRLRPADSTAFRCSTPSTDAVFQGNYEADVRLIVIPDSLQVDPSPPPAVVPEGGALELHCNATRDVLPQAYTHLSVSWSVARETGPEDVLSFGPDGGVAVGPGYAQRYTDGELRLDLPGGGVYGLVLTQASPGDGGVYTCTAGEWSREAGGAWQQILERSAEMGEVQVTPTAQSLAVSVGEDDDITLAVGDTLNLTCSVAVDYPRSLRLEVTWLLSSAPGASPAPAEPRVLAQVGRDGVVKGAGRPVGLTRVEPGAFQLLVRGLARSDSGLYSCRVRAWIHRTTGDWYQAAQNSSHPVRVLVTVKDPVFKVLLLDKETPQFSGDPTELECQVRGVSGLGAARLGVSWLYAEATPGDVIAAGSGSVMATLDAEGTQQAGQGYEDRLGNGELVLYRSAPSTFRLRLLHTHDTDMGAYSCAMAVWSPAPPGWEKGPEVHSEPLNVFWTAKTPRVSVAARRLREVTSAGGTFEMSCQVTGQNLRNPGYSVLIQVEERVGGRTRRVLSLGPDSVLGLEEWSELDRVVLERTSAKEFRFRLYQAQRGDRGFYSCTVTAWTRDPAQTWTRSVSGQSNRVPVAFADKGPVFNISVRSDSRRVAPWETAKLQCILTTLGAAPSPDDVAFELRWFLIRPQDADSAALVASVDRWGVVRKGQRNGSSDCGLERVDAHTYTLSVYSSQDSDGGQYYCQATPWTRPPTGVWARGRDLTSSRIYLTVDFALWDSMQRPLLVGTGVALAVGILSVLLGLICTRCCCRDALQSPQTPGPQDLELDPLNHGPLAAMAMD